MYAIKKESVGNDKEITPEKFAELIGEGAVIRGDDVDDLIEKLKNYHPNGHYLIGSVVSKE